ncbi:ATP-binding protein [Streptomyces sp. NPDC051909]|uniref:ATP-binding protein n=1 Tax=Streptomyces sp. NPDC051909 TaxID=3154944 RepID=UPI003419D9D1
MYATYATTVPGSLTGLTGLTGGAGVRRTAAGDGTGDTRTARIPAPRKPADDDLTQALEHRPEAAGDARHTAQAVLEAWRVDEETAGAVVLVVSELVTNAVEHAQAPLFLHLHREHSGNRVWVGVTDGGPAARDGAWTSSCTEDEHGRGLAVVDMLADAHGTHNHTRGATHWARLTTA